MLEFIICVLLLITTFCCLAIFLLTNRMLIYRQALEHISNEAQHQDPTRGMAVMMIEFRHLCRIAEDALDGVLLVPQREMRNRQEKGPVIR